MKLVNVASVVVVVILLCAFTQAQQTMATNPSVGVPPLVNFTGVLTDVNGKPLTEITGLSFYLYKDQQGGSPLWMETQNVQPDATGHYSVTLGATSSTGLPAKIFATGEAHWLGVQAQGQPEEPRVLLLSVPYALKAVDAATVGGLPPSAFVLAASASGSGTNSSESTAATPLATGTTPVTTAGGTADQLAKFDASADITNSIIFDNGTNVGIGIAAPAAKLDVSGSGIFRGGLGLPAQAAATAAAGEDSQPLTQTASAFNSSTGSAVAQTFQWQAEPTGNDTTTPSGALHLLFGANLATPAETGLHIASNGQITFASGQTFPGTGKGSVTSISTGAGLTGGPITTTGTISIASAGVSNSMLTNPFITVKAGSGLSGGGTVALGGTISLTNAAPSSGGTVTSVASGTGIIGGPITKAGTLSLDTSFTDARYLRVSGGSLTLTGTLTTAGAVLSPISTATPSTAFDSTPLELQASSYNTAIAGAATYDFRWQAEPTGNDTADTGALLHLLFGVSGDISETGLLLDRAGDVITSGNFDAGVFESSTVGGNVTVRGGRDDNSASVLGGLVARGADNVNTASTAAGGFLLERPGLLTGSGPVGRMGVREAGNGYFKGAIVTPWNVQCMTKTANTTADCPAAAIDGNVLGVASNNVTPVLVIESGNVPINATAAVAIGDTVCLSSSTAGKVTDSGGSSPCSTNPNFQGVVVATSGSVVVGNGSSAPTSVTLSTTLPLVHLIGR